eukprot:scaffold8194_cov118-Cylindrotheca_fusiformis.AAC.4
MGENSSKVLHDVDPHHHHDDDWRRYHWYYAGACLLCSRLFIFRPLLQLVAIQGVSLVNFWYPLIATIACVHEQRHPSTTSTITQEEEEEVRQIIIDQKLSSTASRSTADNDDTDHNKSELSAAAAATANTDCHFWFDYWNVYALIQTMDQVLLLIFSILFRDLIPQRNQFMAEMQLFFAIYYLFVMKKEEVSSSSFGYYQEWVQPHILHGHEMISEAISEDAWTNLFASRIEQLMDLMVNIHLMAKPMKDQIVVILKEGRTLIVPATLTLLPITPMFFTRLGVVYSQYLLPVGKAAITTNKKNKDVMVTNHGKEKEKEKEEQNNIRQLHHYLKYWILHSCVSIFFQALSFFWWMPFYHHGMFLFWSYLSFDTTIVEYYNVLELDLISLGILPSGGGGEGDDNSKVEVHQTQTYQFLTAIAKRLPSADEATFQDLLEEEEEEEVVVVETKKHSSRTISTSSSSTTTTTNTTTTDDRVSVDQLKSLIRQLPANQKDLNMDDDETAQILQMLIAKLKKEEAKETTTTTTTAADAGIILDDDDDDDNEVLVDSKQQVNKLEKETTFVSKMVKVDMSGRKLSPGLERNRGGRESNNTTTKNDNDGDEEVFFETRRDLSVNDQHQVARSPPIVARIGNTKNNNNKNNKTENKLEEKKRRLRVVRNNSNIVSSERTSDDSMANKNTTTSNSNDDDDFFDAKEKSERRMISKSREVHDELPASAVRSPVHHGSNRPKEKKKEKSEEKQGRGAHNETLLVSESSCDTMLTDALQSNNNSEDSFDVNDDEHIMPSSELLLLRRSKRERAGLLSKQSSSTRFVSKLLVRIESNQKAKRKEKREKLKEKKKEKVQNNKNTQ